MRRITYAACAAALALVFAAAIIAVHSRRIRALEERVLALESLWTAPCAFHK